MRSRGAFALALALTLAGCDVPTPTGNTASTAQPATLPLSIVFTPVANDTYAFAFPAAADPAQVEEAIRRQCAGKDFCKAFGWIDPTRVARGLPMTDREFDAEALSYSLNRQTGLDEARWTCAMFPDSRPPGCDKTKSVPAR